MTDYRIERAQVLVRDAYNRVEDEEGSAGLIDAVKRELRSALVFLDDIVERPEGGDA